MAFLFLKDREEEREHTAKERALFLADRQEDRLMLSNHLSGTVVVLKELVVELKEHRKWTDGKP